MKEKLTLATSVIGLILIVGVLILGNNLYNLNTTVEAMRSDRAIEIPYEKIRQLDLLQLHIEEKVANFESRIDNLEYKIPNQDLDQFIWSTIAELNRIEDLLNKIDGLETVYGVITDLNKSSQISLNVRVAKLDVKGNYHDTQENIEIKLAENYTPYMVGQFTLAPIDNEEFIKVVEQDLKNDFQQGFTFKIVKGKVVQIYQGYIN